jgi:cytoskeletal protein RodZ
MELFLIILVLLLAFTMPMLMWYKCMTALNEALRLKLMTTSQYNLRKSTIIVTISANMGVDFILGLWSIYELQKDNGKLKTHKVKNPFKRRTNSVSPTPTSTTKASTSSSTTSSTPKGSSIPVKSTEENKAATVVPVTKPNTEVSPNL